MNTSEKLYILQIRAKSLGAILTESGAPRGERRYYHLRMPFGNELIETPSLKHIEQKLDALEEVLLR